MFRALTVKGEIASPFHAEELKGIPNLRFAGVSLSGGQLEEILKDRTSVILDDVTIRSAMSKQVDLKTVGKLTVIQKQPKQLALFLDVVCNRAIGSNTVNLHGPIGNEELREIALASQKFSLNVNATHLLVGPEDVMSYDFGNGLVITLNRSSSTRLPAVINAFRICNQTSLEIAFRNGLAGLDEPLGWRYDQPPNAQELAGYWQEWLAARKPTALRWLLDITQVFSLAFLPWKNSRQPYTNTRMATLLESSELRQILKS